MSIYEIFNTPSNRGGKGLFLFHKYVLVIVVIVEIHVTGEGRKITLSDRFSKVVLRLLYSVSKMSRCQYNRE